MKPYKQLPQFITFDGADGVGKTTQMNLLAERLQATGRNVVKTKALGGTGDDFIQNELRRLLLNPEYPGNDTETEERLFAVADNRNLKLAIKHMVVGKTVVQDRGQVSHLVYCLAKNIIVEFILEYQEFLHDTYSIVARDFGTLNIVLIPESEKMSMDRVLSRGIQVTPRLENLEMQRGVIKELKDLEAHLTKSKKDRYIYGHAILETIYSDHIFVPVAPTEDIPTVEQKILVSLREAGYDI